MKKTILLALTLMLTLLTACAVSWQSQKVEPIEKDRPDPIPIQTPMQSPILQLYPSPLPTPITPYEQRSSLPSFDYEIDRVFYAEGFAEEGMAFLFMSEADAEGRIDFDIYMTQVWHFDNEYGERSWYANDTYTVRDYYPGSEYSVTLAKNNENPNNYYQSVFQVTDPYATLSVGDAVATLSVDKEVMEKDYNMNERVYYFPTELTELTMTEANEAFCNMPLFKDEVIWPLDRRMTLEEVEAVLGESTENVDQTEFYFGENLSVSYSSALYMKSSFRWITTIRSSIPEFIPRVRGIEIGDDMDYVLSRFKNKAGDREAIVELIESDPSENERSMYGLSTLVSPCGYLQVANYMDTYDIILLYDGDILRIYFDEHYRVAMISIVIPT